MMKYQNFQKLISKRLKVLIFRATSRLNYWLSSLDTENVICTYEVKGNIILVLNRVKAFRNNRNR